MAQLRQMSAALRPQPGDVSVNGVDLVATPHASVRANVEDREHAEFSDSEIAAVVKRQEAEEANRFAVTRLERVR
jgi:hypothetical protein